MSEHDDGVRRAGTTRAELLKRAGAAAAVVALSGGRPQLAIAGPLRHSGRELAGELSVVQWSHVTPGYNTWFEETWATDWGRANDVEVTVDYVDYTRLPALAAAEAKAGRGHDVFGFLAPPASYEDLVIDHVDVVREVERQVGSYGALGRRSTRNPRTGRYFGVSPGFVPAPSLWRHDLWNAIGESPATWDRVRAAASTLKGLGHPIGIGLASEPDSNVALLSLMSCFGSSLQDASGAVALQSAATIEAVRFVADLWRSGESADAFAWTPASNNQLLLSGRGSLIVNAVSAIRSAEQIGASFADDLWIWPLPAGPAGRAGLPQYTHVYSIWQFAKNREAAEKFVADLCAGYEQPSRASKLFDYPSFPGAFAPDRLYQAAAADRHAPRGKYTILTTVASRYTRNVGFPGYANAAVEETLARSLIPQMFARVARGDASAEDAVRDTSRTLKRIWARWRAAGRV